MNHIFACCKASVWKDLLTAFDNGTITYDASGNPTSYYNGTRWTMTWENGRQLVSATTDISDTEEMVVEYVYDMNGLRVSKTVTVNTYEAHTHSYTTTVVEPNCTARGYTRYTCACGDSYIDNYVAALGHIYDSLSDKECNRCGYNRNTGGIIITPPDPDYPIIGTGISDVETTSETASDRVLLSTNSEQHDYIYASGKLLREVITTGEGATATTQTLDFFYDANGTPLALKVGNATYYYVTNLQGDVIQLVDSTGTAVAAYEYDPYGNIVFQSGNLADLNPLRYRGYYYDSETELYYVSSRYYDPAIGRWINADNRISGVGGDVLGYNMFAYCMNNPVNMSDPSGGWPKWLETAVKVASVVVAVTAVVVMVATVSAVSAGTAAPGALLGASVFLGAALSGINGGVANEAKGNSYINGYLGGATGGAIQATCSKTPAGTIVGGGAGVTVGTAVTDVMNNLDPDSANSTAKEIASNAITSGGKALVTSSLTAYMGYASDLAAINGANGLMPTYTRGLGEAVKAFFGWLDDALVYIWE